MSFRLCPLFGGSELNTHEGLRLETVPPGAEPNTASGFAVVGDFPDHGVMRAMVFTSFVVWK